MRLERVDLETGERTPSVVIGLENQTGLARIWLGDSVLDLQRGYPDTCQRRLSKLFLVGGAR